jgi:hypothetical protein
MPAHVADFWVLRRWNSYTPPLPLPEPTRGGGYYIELKEHGFAVDPGFSYLQNLHQCSIPVSRLEGVLLTHKHIDHTADFETIRMVHFERAEAARNSDVQLDAGVLKFFYSDSFTNVETQKLELHSLVSGAAARPLVAGRMDVESFDVMHGMGAVGLKFRLRLEGEHEYRIGITSDTAYFEGLSTHLVDCDIVVMHLGSIDVRQLASSVFSRYGDEGELRSLLARLKVKHLKDERLLKQILGCEDFTDLICMPAAPLSKKHLGLEGVLRLTRELTNNADSKVKTIILSEFGRELGSFRHKVAEVLGGVANEHREESNQVKVLTGDIGLRVAMHSSPMACEHDKCGESALALIQCTRCLRYFCQEHITEVCLKYKDMAMYYNCPTCLEREYSPPDH